MNLAPSFRGLNKIVRFVTKEILAPPLEAVLLLVRHGAAVLAGALPVLGGGGLAGVDAPAVPVGDGGVLGHLLLLLPLVRQGGALEQR